MTFAHQASFDFQAEPASAKARQGAVAYHAGAAAEMQVAQDYERRGHHLLHLRWRGQAGEIDLIFRNQDEIVFVEVKKSRSFARALQMLTARQLERIFRASEEFLASQPHGLLTEMRIDVAILDQHGQIQILENAPMAG